MQILLVNGSSRVDGNTAEALTLLDESFQKRGVKTTFLYIYPIKHNGAKYSRRCVLSGKILNKIVLKRTAKILPSA